MSKYNGATVSVARGSGVIQNTNVAVRTAEGGIGFVRTPKSELFLAGVSSLVEDNFYEKAATTASRIRGLVKTVAVEDAKWIQDFVFWLRHTANMRSVSLSVALDAAKVLNDAKITGGRAIVAAAMDRADEPAEAVAYWHANYGRRIPQSVKRGIADAAQNLYTERSLVKYDSDSKAVRFADVIQLTHPLPKTAIQSVLFKHALDRRYNAKVAVPEALKFVKSNSEFKTADLDLDNIKGATWEQLSSKTKMDAAAWEAVIPTMGYMALLKNLRNFVEAGVDRKVLNAVAAKIADPLEVAKSKQLPFRFWSAYNAIGGNNVFKLAIDDALNASASNVPALKGKTLILVDVSGSMGAKLSDKSEVSRYDAAALFAGVLASRANDATLVWFDGSSGQVNFDKKASALEIKKAIPNCGGWTSLDAAVARWYKAGFDRVVVLTDEQHNGGRVFAPVPSNVPVFVWNLGGYAAAASNQSNVYTQGGLSDASFGYIDLITAGVTEKWPWLK